jgi:hypothetical protein
MGTNTARSSEDGAVRRRIGLLRRAQHGFMYVQFVSYLYCTVHPCAAPTGWTVRQDEQGDPKEGHGACGAQIGSAPATKLEFGSLAAGPNPSLQVASCRRPPSQECGGGGRTVTSGQDDNNLLGVNMYSSSKSSEGGGSSWGRVSFVCDLQEERLPPLNSDGPRGGTTTYLIYQR